MMLKLSGLLIAWSLKLPFFLVELRRRTSDSHQTGTSLKQVSYILGVPIWSYALFLAFIITRATTETCFVIIFTLLKMLQLAASKGIEFEREILEAEYTFIADKVVQLQDKVRFPKF
jgi:hypothetical protein